MGYIPGFSPALYNPAAAHGRATKMADDPAAALSDVLNKLNGVGVSVANPEWFDPAVLAQILSILSAAEPDAGCPEDAPGRPARPGRARQARRTPRPMTDTN